MSAHLPMGEVVWGTRFRHLIQGSFRMCFVMSKGGTFCDPKQYGNCHICFKYMTDRFPPTAVRQKFVLIGPESRSFEKNDELVGEPKNLF